MSPEIIVCRIESINEDGEGKQIFIKIVINEIEVEALINPGAGVSLINNKLVNNTEPLVKKYRLVSTSGSTILVLGQVNVNILLGDLNINHNFILSNDIPI